MTSPNSKSGLLARFAVLFGLLLVVPALCLLVLKPRRSEFPEVPPEPRYVPPTLAHEEVPRPAGPPVSPGPAPETPSVVPPPTRPEPPPPVPPPVPAADDPSEPVRDLFAAFRSSLPYPDDYWQKIDEALRHIQVLRGAYVEPSTRQLILVGDYTEQEGPLGLQDLSAIFWGEFMGDYSERLGTKPGVTIDPENGDDWETKPMRVFYGGNTENTRVGRRMFECDWLLKGLGLGVEEIAPKAKRDQIPGFETHIERAAGSKLPASNVCTRFWIALSDENGGRDDRTIPLQVDPGKQAIWFPPGFQLYACTELMIQEPNGDRRSSGGLQDEGAAEFVRHFNQNFESYAEVFPVLHELRECAKLMVLAHWLRERRPEPGEDTIVVQPADFLHELMYLGFPESEDSRTPTEKPVQQGAHGSVAMHGGVSLQAPAFGKPFDNSGATSLASRVRANRKKLPAYGGYVAPANAPRSEAFAVIGAPPTGPPAVPRRRPKLLSRSVSTGEISVSTRRPPAATAPYDVVSDPQFLDFPVLRVGTYTGQGIQSGRVEIREMPSRRMVWQGEAGLIPDQLEFTSASGNVRGIRFDSDIQVDQTRDDLYFKVTNASTQRHGILSFFPQSRSCRAADGTEFRFSPTTGLIQQVDTPDGRSFRFEHHRLEDGPLFVGSELSPQELARPPPGRSTEEFVRQPNPRRAALPLRKVSTGEITVSSLEGVDHFKAGVEDPPSASADLTRPGDPTTGRPLAVENDRLQDDPLVRNPELGPNELARPPPAGSTGESDRRTAHHPRNVSTGKIGVSPLGNFDRWVTVTNLKTRESVEILREDGEIVILEETP